MLLDISDKIASGILSECLPDMSDRQCILPDISDRERDPWSKLPDVSDR